MSPVIVSCRIVNILFYSSESAKGELMLAARDPGTEHGDRQAQGDGNTDCMPERGW